MTGEQVTRRVYSAEQLHRLRVSCSQPKLSEAIEQNDEDDAELIKEHVLRGTKSFTARSFRSRNSATSLRVPSNKENHSTGDVENGNSSAGNDISLEPRGFVLGEIPANGQFIRPGGSRVIRPSPTPSLKKKKAEAIVKAHGSPQHVRVTAGGRIVPSEQSPLCHPRYGYSAIKTNGGLIKFAPNHPVGKTHQWTQATQNGFVAQDVNGHLCQIVNGTILPLKEVDGALHLYVPAPNLSITPQGPPCRTGGHPRHDDHRQTDQQRESPLSTGHSTREPPLPVQTHALQMEYDKLDHELSELNKNEVRVGAVMPRAQKESLVAKRRQLVTDMDVVRKAIKAIKQAHRTTDTVPTVSLAASDHHSIPQTRATVPHLIQQRTRLDMTNGALHPGPLYGYAGPQQLAPEHGFQPPQIVETAYGHAPFVPTQVPIFIPPPSFDGSIAPSFAPFPDNSALMSLSNGHSLPETSGPPAADDCSTQLPQTDGTGSINDCQNAKSPARSHAVDIKLPELKQATALKSNLNPMSPAYKPGSGVLQNFSNSSNATGKVIKGSADARLSPVHQLKPLPVAGGATNGSEETISSMKKSPHLQSSSVSSFDTADFFPRNTREYSTRMYAYAEQSVSEDKENVNPDQSDLRPTQASGSIQQEGKGTASSPSAPVHHLRTDKPQSSKSDFQPFAGTPVHVRSRQTNNASPNNRRSDHIFVYEDPASLPSLPPSSPVKPQSYVNAQVESTVVPDGKIDYSDCSVDWIHGYRAGLARKPVEADRIGDFLDGYCAGLLKSRPARSCPTSTGTPTKASISHRPSPAVVQSGFPPDKDNQPQHAPIETRMNSMDTLKEAVFAPVNENTILSPSTDGPHIDDAPLNLGAWAKSRGVVDAAEAMVYTSGDGLAGFPFPHHTNSMMKQRKVVSDATPDASGDPVSRVVSLSGLDTNLYNQWPGARVFSSQLEYKSASSVAQAAGLASGHFARPESVRGLPAYLTKPGDSANVSQGETLIAGNSAMHAHSRFQEGSLDGITNPPNSPQQRSLPVSPSQSAGNKGVSGSPVKGVSPTKVKFESMAEKVGIKVSSGAGKKDKHPGCSPTAGLGKRGWRDVWRGSSRKDVSKDDGVDFSLP